MFADEYDLDHLPVTRLTLDHRLPSTNGDWLGVTAIAFDGPDVVVRVMDARPIRMPRTAVVRARLRDERVGEDPGALEIQMSGWYAGDLEALQAVAPAAAVTSNACCGAHPLVRDPSLTGIYGGDLDALVDSFGVATEADQAARSRRTQAEAHVCSAPQSGRPPKIDDDEVLTHLMSGYDGGDVSALASRGR